jgi:integrase
MSEGRSQRAGAREPREPGAELSEGRRGAPAAGAGVAEAISGWRPRTVGERAAAFARAVVARAAVPTPARARALLFAAARLAEFGERVGLEPRAEVLLAPAVIERFVVVDRRSRSPATRRTLRTNLRHLARRVQRYPQPEPVPLPRERAKAPYREREIAGYLALAAAQPTVARRMRAGALICLGAGAGLVGSELRHLRGIDVVERSGGLMVIVGGRRARVVPVLRRFHEPLRAAAAFAGRAYLLGGTDPGRRNLSDALTAALCSDAGLPRLEAGRLRATWLAECARLIGLGAFMQAAGIRCSQRLGDLVAELPEVDEQVAVALLGGARGGGGGASAA